MQARVNRLRLPAPQFFRIHVHNVAFTPSSFTSSKPAAQATEAKTPRLMYSLINVGSGFCCLSKVLVLVHKDKYVPDK
jgi:flagellar biosynthesis/type III secretory pathway M-ring protein FliF/YscJ